LLGDWRAKAQATGRVKSELEILVLTALSYIAGADLEQAQQTLLTALSLAQPEGFIRLFLDERAALTDLLRAIVAHSDEDALDRYARSLLSTAVYECAGDAPTRI